MIDQTEAMATIDVNTGSYVGGRSLEDTVFKTNMEATQVIARQLRLRNLGGIIIIDFIDMQEAQHREEVMKQFERMLERDHAKTKITQVSELGLVEMTRKPPVNRWSICCVSLVRPVRGGVMSKQPSQYVTKYSGKFYAMPVLMSHRVALLLSRIQLLLIAC